MPGKVITNAGCGVVGCTPESPATIAGSVAWWYGDSLLGTVADTDPIPDWLDTSLLGGSNDLVAAGADRPTFVEQVANANNQPGVKFTAAQTMQAASKIIDDLASGPSGTRGFGVHMVYADVQAGSGPVILTEGTGSTDGVRVNGPELGGGGGMEWAVASGFGISFAPVHSNERGIMTTAFTGAPNFATNITSVVGIQDGAVKQHGISDLTALALQAAFPATINTKIGYTWAGTLMSMIILSYPSLATFLDEIEKADCWAFNKYGPLNTNHGFNKL